MARPRMKDSETGKDIYDAEELAKKLLIYADEAKPYPTIRQFLYKNKLTRTRFYEIAKESKILTDAIDLMHSKAEYVVEFLTAAGKMNSSFGLFKLKQPVFGWTDRSEKEVDTKPVININIPEFKENE